MGPKRLKTGKWHPIKAPPTFARNSVSEALSQPGNEQGDLQSVANGTDPRRKRSEHAAQAQRPAAAAALPDGPSADISSGDHGAADNIEDNGHRPASEIPSDILQPSLDRLNGALISVAGDPYSWPFDGHWSTQDSALVVIDMQVDFCGVGGYVSKMGYDVSPMRALIPAIRSVLAAARAKSMMVVHTREGHRGDLSDLPPNKLWRSRQVGACIGEEGPCGRVLVQGEPGWQIIPELSPASHEPIIDKPGKGAFYATDLEMILRVAGIRNLIFCGVTTDVCVTTTMREANDRGFECLLLQDCCAATEQRNHEAALAMTKMQGGIFGSIATAEALLAALRD